MSTKLSTRPGDQKYVTVIAEQRTRAKMVLRNILSS